MREECINVCSFDFNGNHVIQKIVVIIQRFENSNLYPKLIAEIEKKVLEYSVHEYCCRIIQRMIENCKIESMTSLIDKILANYDKMISD